MLNNINIVFKNKKTNSEKNKIAFFSYYHFILTCFEFLSERKGRLGDHVTIENKNILDSALKENKGAYILCVHMGSWEAMGGAFSRIFGPSHIIVKKVGPAGIHKFVSKLRRRNNFYSISKGKKGDALLKIKQVLDRKQIIGFVMDQKRPKSPYLPLFGRAAKTNTTLAYLWQKKQAPIIPAFIKRTSIGKHTIKILPSIQLEKSDNEQQDLLNHSLIFNQTVEKIILSCPEQYFWFHNRWKL